MLGGSNSRCDERRFTLGSWQIQYFFHVPKACNDVHLWCTSVGRILSPVIVCHPLVWYIKPMPLDGRLRTCMSSFWAHVLLLAYTRRVEANSITEKSWSLNFTWTPLFMGELIQSELWLKKKISYILLLIVMSNSSNYYKFLKYYFTPSHEFCRAWWCVVD